MDEGAKVGALARSYVPGGRLIKRGRSMSSILAESWGALADPSVPAIYECAVIADDTLVFPDILERVEGGFVLIEVKSKTSVSEHKHIPDIAIQAYVLRRSIRRRERSSERRFSSTASGTRPRWSRYRTA